MRSPKIFLHIRINSYIFIYKKRHVYLRNIRLCKSCPNYNLWLRSVEISLSGRKKEWCFYTRDTCVNVLSFSTIVLTCLEDNCESCYKITFRRTTRFWSDMRKIRIFGKTWEWLLKLLMYWFLMLVYKSLGLTMTKRTIFVSRLQCFWFILYRDVSFVDQINTRRFGLFNLNTVRYHPMSPYRNGGGGGVEALVQSGSSLLLEISFILFEQFLP